MGRIFPELERITRQNVDLGIGFRPDSGAIIFRAENESRPAIDGQAGTILRFYREHQMSANGGSSYGTFISACGFEYHGLKGYMAFDPKISPENFKAPFTSAEGWGTFKQSQVSGKQLNTIGIVCGKLRLKTFGIKPLKGMTIKNVMAKVNGERRAVSFRKEGDKYIIDFKSELELVISQKLDLILS